MRHIDEPNGSATTPLNPSLMNAAGMPSTVSEPNHVANTVAVTMYIGRRRPATAKSRLLCTHFAA
jgi:hypothetical protein